MSIKTLAKSLERFTVANSPALLTAVAVTGTVTTAILAGQASFKAAKFIAEEEQRILAEAIADKADEPEPFETPDKVKLVLPLYIPAIGSCITTIAAMIAANQIGTRRAAAMAAAYSMSEKAFGEYREKIVEKMGEKKEQAARDEIAQERVNQHPVATQQVIMLNEREVLCFDQHSGRYFQSDMETLKKAQNDLNYRILQDSYASLNDFYDRVGLEIIPTGEELGWTSDKQLELMFSTVLSPDQRPCIAIDFMTAPMPDHYKFR